jgi:hypothetical protein
MTLWVGASPSRGLVGMIDDLKVFERPLTHTEVNLLFDGA